MRVSRQTPSLSLASVLRPRLTFKYILCSGTILYVAYCWLLGMPLLSSNLPPYTGPYGVGAIDIEVPCDSRRVHDAVFKSNGRPAFQLDTVLFTVYYPANKDIHSSKPGHLWVPKPVSLTAEGYARFAHINNAVTRAIFSAGLWALAGSNRIPAAVDVPLQSEPGSIDSDSFSETEKDAYSLYHVTSPGSQYPVLVFSHGMASMRTDYTQYAGELASRGYVVAMIEHRDGSGPGSIVTTPNGKKRKVTHISKSQLKYDPPLDTAAFKEAQLAFRRAEIEDTIRVLRAINEGQGDRVFRSNVRKEGADLINWQGRLDTSSVTLGGHSYGATGVLGASEGAPSSKMPINGCIALDPGKSSGPLNDKIDVPLMIIHSNSWSSMLSIFYGRPHFDVVRDLAQTVLKRGHDAWFFTSLGTTHPSCTDAPLIEPFLLSWTTGSTIEVREGVQQYVKRTVEFMEYIRTGEKQGLLGEDVTNEDYKDTSVIWNKKDRKEAFEKYWQIHVAPPDQKKN